MDNYDVVIVIPIYKVNIEWYEQLSLERAINILGKYAIVVCCPESLDLGSIKEKYDINRVERFNDNYFTGIEAYNHLMLSCEFYERFLAYKYMLIYQLDAFIFIDVLQIFCNLGYDYIGAPWTQPIGICEYKGSIHRLRVGNGGLSLRKINSCIDILKRYNNIVLEWNKNEDLFFSCCGYYHSEEFRIAPFDVAKKFSFEASVRRLYKKNNGMLPFGCHAWMKFGGDIYPLLFKKAGVDIEKYKTLLRYEDLEYEISRFTYRLHNKIIKLSSFKDVLPNRKCWSIVCFGKIGKQLAKYFWDNDIEIKAIYDSGFSDSNGEWNNIKLIKLDDIKCLEKEKGMVIISTLKYEKELTEIFEEHGWVYGQDFVSVRREYARRFKSLGYEKYLYKTVFIGVENHAKYAIDFCDSPCL